NAGGGGGGVRQEAAQEPGGVRKARQGRRGEAAALRAVGGRGVSAEEGVAGGDGETGRAVSRVAKLHREANGAGDGRLYEGARRQGGRGGCERGAQETAHGNVTPSTCVSGAVHLRFRTVPG